MGNKMIIARNLATKDNDHNVHSCYSNTAGQPHS